MEYQEFSLMQYKSLVESDARINIWQGAVRSGKSFSSLLRFIEYLYAGPPGDLIIVGRTDRSIKRNIINMFMEFIGADCRYYSGKGEMKVWGRTVYVVGANDERAEGKIRGATLAGAYVDEITLIPESFFSMLLSRLSIKGAKLFGTTNPDGPYHWFKANYLDRADDLSLKTWLFKIYDNPSLDQEYIRNLEMEYTGLWKKRFIEGLWVLADGAVYDFFNEDIHVIPQKPEQEADYYICGVDYGTSNPTVFLLAGVKEGGRPRVWIEKEYYYDSRAKNRQKTDDEYAKDLKTFLGEIKPRKIYIDPSAASFQVQLRRDGVYNIQDANNDVLDGIRTCSRMLNSGEIKICANCTNLIKEFSQYFWDAKAAQYGEDKPAKQHDHAMDSLRYIAHTHFGAYSVNLQKLVTI